MNALLRLLGKPQTDKVGNEFPYHIIDHQGQTCVVNSKTGEILRPKKGESLNELIARFEAKTK